jgi:hypothetical protein
MNDNAAAGGICTMDREVKDAYKILVLSVKIRETTWET